MKYLVIILIIALTGCANEVTLQQAINIEPVGFWYGLWHGIISTFAFVLSLFTDVSVYAIYNTGPWYDFGFLLGLGGFSITISNRS